LLQIKDKINLEKKFRSIEGIQNRNLINFEKELKKTDILFKKVEDDN